MPVTLSKEVEEKLAEKHNVSPVEVYECFANREGPYLLEDREEHQTDPPSYWFVAETDKCRKLKVIFVRYPDHFAIKSAFEPEDGSEATYARICEKLAQS